MRHQTLLGTKRKTTQSQPAEHPQSVQACQHELQDRAVQNLLKKNVLDIPSAHGWVVAQSQTCEGCIYLWALHNVCDVVSVRALLAENAPDDSCGGVGMVQLFRGCNPFKVQFEQCPAVRLRNAARESF